MTVYDKKCIGCSAQLSNDPDSIGFVTKFDSVKTKYCTRCFRIINYGEINNNELIGKQIEETLNSLNYELNNQIYHVLDILNLDNSIIKELAKFNNKIVFIVNKIDVLPKSCNSDMTYDMIYKTITSYGFVDPRILLVSKYNSSSIKRLYKFIKNEYRNNNCKSIFIGKSNAGKSSLIDELLKQEDSSKSVVISPFVNTTITLKQYKFKSFVLIDTPGMIDSGSILNYIDNKEVKKIFDFKCLKPINFYIEQNQTIMIEKLALINFLKGKKSSFTFYCSNNLNLFRMKLENSIKNFQNEKFRDNLINYKIEPKLINHTLQLDKNKKHNISISGLGLISISKGVEEISITLDENVEFSLNSFAII